MEGVDIKIRKSKELVDAIWQDQSLFDKNYLKAEVLLKAVLKVEPQNVRALTNLGAVLSDTGRHSQALEILRIAENLGAVEMNLFRNIAIAMMNLNEERSKAKEYFEWSLIFKEDPMTIDAYFDPHAH